MLFVMVFHFLFLIFLTILMMKEGRVEDMYILIFISWYLKMMIFLIGKVLLVLL